MDEIFDILRPHLTTLITTLVILIAGAIGTIFTWIKSERFRAAAVAAFVFLIRSLLPTQEEKTNVGRDYRLDWSLSLCWALYQMKEDPHMFMDADGNVLRANDALCEMLGTSESSLIGGRWVTFVVPEKQRDVLSTWEIARTTGARFSHRTQMGINGHSVHVHLMIFPAVEDPMNPARDRSLVTAWIAEVKNEDFPIPTNRAIMEVLINQHQVLIKRLDMDRNSLARWAENQGLPLPIWGKDPE